MPVLMPAVHHPAGAIAPAMVGIASLFLEAIMLKQSSCPSQSSGACPDPVRGKAISSDQPSALPVPGSGVTSTAPDDDTVIEWSEEDVVLLHWRLLREVRALQNPETPLEEKLDTLRWIFTERDKESRPFSFVNCLMVVGCSPLSPTPYVGFVDAEEIRDAIRCQVSAWLNATLARYPCWVRDAFLSNPGWIENCLSKNPQWINEQIKKHQAGGDLFA